MSTILTDDERTAIIQAADSNTEALSSSDMRLVELTEVAVLAKLAQQEAVAVFRTDSNWGHVDLLAHCGPPMVDGQRLYTHRAPQADRQRVPEGYVLVPVEPTDEMVDAACDKSDFFRVDFVLAWDAAINASPELTQSATSHTHKVVPVTPTKEMLISGARAPVELLSPDGALQVYRAMLAAAPEAPAQAPKAAEQVEFLDAQNHQLRRAIHAAMSRLCALLDEDQFAEMEQIFACAGVAAPEAPAQADAVDERDRKDAERYRWLRDALVSDDPYDFAVQAFGHFDEDRKLTPDDFDACISAALAQKGGAA